MYIVRALRSKAPEMPGRLKVAFLSDSSYFSRRLLKSTGTDTVLWLFLGRYSEISEILFRIIDYIMKLVPAAIQGRLAAAPVRLIVN